MFINRPNRLPGYDYSRDNYYFITSVVKNRNPCFGEINNGKMKLNEFGQIALKQLRWLDNNYSYVKLHEHVIMPDHIHAIVEINSSVGSGRDLNLPCCGQTETKIKSLSELIGAFKMTSSKQIRLKGLTDFQWQTSFHDRIIRTQTEFDLISKYIIENPIKEIESI